MATATMGPRTPHAARPPPMPDSGSSDTMSPVYPDRPIRPLPRRSLRARLSPEVADTITYPPAPASRNSLFYPQYQESGYSRNSRTGSQEIGDIDRALIEAQNNNIEGSQGYRFKGNEVDSEEEEGLGTVQRFQEYYSQHGIPPPSRGNPNGVARNGEGIAQSVTSSTDSIDGYDSFENTNNKKKRKIPTSNLSSHSAIPASLSAGLAGISLCGQEEESAFVTPDGAVGQYYGNGHSVVQTSPSGTGISGAGRGRYGRSGKRDPSGRSPLGVSANLSNAWQAGRFVTGRGSSQSLGTQKGEADKGIIEATLDRAATLPSTPSKGQEIVSVLNREPSKKASDDKKKQFTFTCESESTKGTVWPEYNSSPARQNENHYEQHQYSPMPPQIAGGQPTQKGFSTQGTQTSPTMAGQSGQNGPLPAANQQGTQPARKPRRPAKKRYAMAARERRHQQEYQNYHHPPKEEDFWICEFCEYENIYGQPPVNLIREYEIKDRRERKRLAEKRRLLEKAKMRGRKGKKGSKNAKNNNPNPVAPLQSANPQDFDNQQHSRDLPPVQDQGPPGQVGPGSELCWEYDGDPGPLGRPPPPIPGQAPTTTTTNETTSRSEQTARRGGYGLPAGH